jgi:hypothetical protein
MSIAARFIDVPVTTDEADEYNRQIIQGGVLFPVLLTELRPS